MKNCGVLAAAVACLALVACGRSESPKTSPSTTPPSSAANATKVEAKKDEAPHAPDLHGMPGMADLFKGDEKPAAKPSEKPADKASEKK